MKILIAGADGQLGQALQHVLTKHQLLPLNHAGLDITNVAHVSAVFSTSKPDLVINTAAYNQVDKAETDSAKALLVNAHGAGNLAAAAASFKIPIVHLSTDYVFDGKKSTPYTELDPTGPVNVYGQTKLKGEEAVRNANSKHYIVRTAWIFSSYGTNFLKTMLKYPVDRELCVVNDQMSSPTYAPHLAKAIESLITNHDFGTYHLVNNGVASRYTQLKHFFDKMGITRAIKPIAMDDFPQPAKRPRYSAMTSVKAKDIVLPSWQDGIAEAAKEFITI